MGLLYTVGIDIAGPDHVALASGLIAFSGGVALLASPPLAGTFTCCKVTHFTIVSQFFFTIVPLHIIKLRFYKINIVARFELKQHRLTMLA